MSSSWISLWLLTKILWVYSFTLSYAARLCSVRQVSYYHIASQLYPQEVSWKHTHTHTSPMTFSNRESDALEWRCRRVSDRPQFKLVHTLSCARTHGQVAFARQRCDYVGQHSVSFPGQMFCWRLNFDLISQTTEVSDSKARTLPLHLILSNSAVYSSALVRLSCCMNSLQQVSVSGGEGISWFTAELLCLCGFIAEGPAQLLSASLTNETAHI